MTRVLMLNYEYPPLGGGAGNANYHLLSEFKKREDTHRMAEANKAFSHFRF